MIDYQINTYWNVETTYQVLNGVASLMGSGDYTGLIKLVMVTALMAGLIIYALGKKMDFAQWLVQALVLTTLMNLPIARVIITDKTGMEPTKVVANVPWTLATGAYLANNIPGWLVSKYETIFNVPDSLGLAKGDLSFGHQILSQTNKVMIRDPNLKSDLMQFFKECTIYDVNDGAISARDLIGGTDSWNLIFNNTNPGRFVTYDTLTGSPKTASCKDVATILKGRVNSGLSSAMAFYGRKMFPRAQTNAVASAAFASAVGESYSWILQSNGNASDAIKQSMFNNIWREAGSELPAMLNDPARVAEVSSMMGGAIAAGQAKGSQSVVTMLAQETIPHLRNWLEAILYALFPVVVILIIVSSPDKIVGILSSYFSGFITLGLIPLIFALVNHLSLLYLKKKMAALALANTVPFQLTDAFDATITDEQTAIGYMIILAIPIAAWLGSRLQGSFVSMGDKIMGSFSGAGSTAGASAALGNTSLGQQSIDTRNINSTSMNKYDGDLSLLSGQFTSRNSMGTTRVMAQNGDIAQIEMRNSLPYSFSIGNTDNINRSTNSTTGQDTRFSTNSSTNTGLATGLRVANTSGRNQTDSQGKDYSNEKLENSGLTNTSGGSYHVDRNAGQNGEYTEGLNQQLGINGYIGLNGIGSGHSKDGSVTGNGTGVNGAGGNGNGGKGANNQGNKPAKGKPGKMPLVNGGVTGDARRTYDAHASTSKTISDSSGNTKHAGQELVDGVTFNQNNRQSIGETTAQTKGKETTGDLTTNNSWSSGIDAVSGRNNAINNSAEKSQSFSIDRRTDLASMPNYTTEVAKSLNMSPAEFANLSPKKQHELMEQHAMQQQDEKNARAMPTQFINGESVPTQQGITEIGDANRNAVPGTQRIIDKSIQNMAAPGVNPSDLAPLAINQGKDPQAIQIADTIAKQREGVVSEATEQRKKVDPVASPYVTPAEKGLNLLDTTTKAVGADATSALMAFSDGVDSAVNSVRGNPVAEKPNAYPVNAARQTTSKGKSIPVDSGTIQRYGAIDSEIKAASAYYKLPPATLAGIIYAESSFDPKNVSPTNCKGLGQFDRNTWKSTIARAKHPDLKALQKLPEAEQLEKRLDPHLATLATAENLVRGYYKTQEAFERNNIKDEVKEADLYAYHNTGNSNMAVNARLGKGIEGAVSKGEMKANIGLYNKGSDTKANDYLAEADRRINNGKAAQNAFYAKN